LTITLLALGDHDAAAKTAEDLMRGAVYVPSDIYDAACYLARCVCLAEQDKALAEANRGELVKAYGDRALAALRHAVEKGYKNLAHMKKDPDLDPLRGREDFKKLLAELKGR
jgi:hypothetical protein